MNSPITETPVPAAERRVLRLDDRARVLILKHLQEQPTERVLGFFEEPRERRHRRTP